LDAWSSVFLPFARLARLTTATQATCTDRCVCLNHRAPSSFLFRHHACSATSYTI
jgi:hypothetical protein